MDGFCKLVCQQISEDEDEKVCDAYINAYPKQERPRHSYPARPVYSVKTPPRMEAPVRYTTPWPYRLPNP